MLAPSRPGKRIPAGAVGCMVFVLIGWTGLLIPSLIRSVKVGFDQSDAGIGAFYFLYAVAYASGSFGGGLVTERIGRHAVLSIAAALHGGALIALGIAPLWAMFLLAAVPAGLGAGALERGICHLGLCGNGGRRLQLARPLPGTRSRRRGDHGPGVVLGRTDPRPAPVGADRRSR